METAGNRPLELPAPPPHGHVTPPPPGAWRESWTRDAPQLRTLRQQIAEPAEVQVQVLRVNQVDASRLDVEMTGMLREQFLRIFSLVQPGLLSEYETELNAVLELLIWRFSIWLDRPTPGNALMNLRYRDERAYRHLARAGKVRTGLEGPGLTATQKILYCLLTVGVRYATTRVSMMSAFQRWGDRNRRAYRHLARAGKVRTGLEGPGLTATQKILYCLLTVGVRYATTRVSMMSAFQRYKSVVERALSARLVYERPTMSRAVSFEYMNRQLVWNEFSELLLLVLPLLNLGSIRRAILSPFSSSSSSSSAASAAAASADDACPICQARPVNTPYVASPCAHTFCYYCIRTRSLADPAYKCPACNAQVVAIRRHHPVQELKRPGGQPK
eukprot:jgi/Mesen1/7945/ME000422S07096